MKKARLLITTVIALSFICVLLIGYILYERLIQSEHNAFCIQVFSASDLTWEVMNFGQDGYLLWHYDRHPFEQDHWGEKEFIILEAAIDSFVPFEEGFVPPWWGYRTTWWDYQWRMSQPPEYRSPERQWWEFVPPNEPTDVLRIWRIAPPFNIVFMLLASKPYSELGWDGNRWQLFDMQENISFLFSEEYGAFAITRFGNIPRGNYCPSLHFQFFHMDTDAFLALFKIIEYDRDLPPPLFCGDPSRKIER